MLLSTPEAWTEGSERAGQRAWDPVLSSLPSCLLAHCRPRTGTVTHEVPTVTFSPSSHVRPPLELSSIKRSDIFPNCKISRWPCSSWINTKEHCQAYCKLLSNLLSPHQHKSLCVHQGVILPMGPGPDQCAFSTSTRVLCN